MAPTLLSSFLNIILICSPCFQDKRKRAASQPASAASAGTRSDIVEAAYLDMMRDKKRLNRLKAKAVIAESYEAAKYWRLRREALKAKLLAKGVNVPETSNMDLSDSPFHTGDLGRFIQNDETDTDRIVDSTFLHLIIIVQFFLLPVVPELDLGVKNVTKKPVFT